MAGKANIKQYQQLWAEYKDSLIRSTPVDRNEGHAAQQIRIKRLEANPEEWFKYYFTKDYTSEPAPFHIKASLRVINNPEWYEVRSWSRELSKSGRTMMEVLYLVLAKKTKRNILLVSDSYDNAERLLLPYRANLETNPRIINDYGLQERLGSWESGNFKTRGGAAFRAIGAKQNPRGAKNEGGRPDVILIDDIDTDEDCRNPEGIKVKWKWVEKALIGTRSVSNPMLIIFCGNIIAKYCCITEAGKMADKWEIINIRDTHGKSTWPAKNTEAMIDRVLSKISYFSYQGEYYNNPIDEGSVFKEMAWKPARPLREYSLLVCYTDPSFKETKKNDYKATVLVGKWRDEFHIIKAFVEQTSTAKMIDWHYQLMDLIGPQSCYYLMEQVFLQDIIITEFYTEGARRGRTIPIKGDERKKDDKFTRIETLLEPLSRNGKLFLNQAEEDNPHMQRLQDQFKALAPGSRAHDDGPDAVEGAVWIINKKMVANAASIKSFSRPKSSKRI